MATLTVTLTEDLTLDGTVYSTSGTVAYTNVNYAYKQTINVPFGSLVGPPAGTFTTLLTLGTSVGGGSVVRANLKYVRIKNLSITNFVVLRLQKSAGDTVFVKLPAGESLVRTAADIDTNTNGAAFAAWQDLDSVAALADTAACKVEVFVATA